MESLSFRRVLCLLALVGAWGIAAAFTTPVRGLVPRVAAATKQPIPWRLESLSLEASTYPDATTAYTNPDTASTIQDLLNLTNKERYRNGLAELQYNKELEKSAQRHAADMAKNNYFSHDGLNGSDLKDRVGLTDYSYSNVGENLFWRTPDNDPSYAIQGWMESPGHRKNMLDNQFSEIGLGYAVDEVNGKHYYVQVFGRPTSAGPPPSPAQPVIDVGVNSGPPPGLGVIDVGVNGGPPELAADATRNVIFQATNDARMRQGLPPFRVSQDLTWGAQEQADDMVQTGKLVSQIKQTSYTRFFTQLGARFAARELKNDPEAALKGWLTKGPQSDLLSERFSETGIGYATDGDQHYYVQLFGSPMETGASMSFPVGAQTMGALSDSMPQKRKRSDRERNSDFGREGFGSNHAERRAEEEELDDDWSDDRRVRARLAQRAMQRVQRPKSSEFRDSQKEKFASDFERQREYQRRLREGPGPNDFRYSSQPPPPRSRSSMTPSNGKVRNAVGFDDNWNQDYVGTANTRQYRIGGGSMGPRNRNDFYDDYGPRGGRDDYYGRGPQRGGRYEDDRRGGFEYQRRAGSNGRGGFDDRRDQRSNGRGGFDDRRDQRGQNRRYRGNTPSAFGRSPDGGSPGRSGSEESVNTIHFQRHAQQQRMRDMPFDGGFDGGFYGGPPDMYDDPRMGPRMGNYGPRRGGFSRSSGMFDRRFEGPYGVPYDGYGPGGVRRPRGQGFIGPDNW